VSTAIEWTDTTWNPTTGCDKVSPGCDNCYALTLARRLKAMGQGKYQNDGDPRTSGPGFGITTHSDTLPEPFQWRTPRRVFVDSMSDLFHARVPVDFIARVWEVMAATPHHTYQILTKRPKRLARVVRQVHKSLGFTEPLPNVWLGTSVEDQQRADQRVPALLNAPAALRFLSLEPLLGPVNLSDYFDRVEFKGSEKRSDVGNVAWYGPRIGWVIVGGESGPGARPMHPQWATSLRDQSHSAAVPFFFKQWGAYEPTGWKVIGTPQDKRCVLVGDPIDDLGHLIEMRRVGKKAAGRELDGRTWDQLPGAVSVS
jgi:protein gp37